MLLIHPLKEARLLKFILGFTLLLLIFGFVAPLLTLNKFLFIENTFSILSGTLELLIEGQIFLFMLITIFSIVLPILKIGILFRLLNLRNISVSKLDKYLHWMHLYGKWSMLDVFVVAVLVVSVKLGTIASVEIRYGIYFFSAAVLLTMVVTARVVRLTEKFKINITDTEDLKQS